jgi:membrane dipeptidase
MFHRLGVRYMTLTWNNTNNWADGILDEARHDGLTGFGREVVREMNRLGIIVDISHVAVKTFWDAIETSSKPVMASHSSARAICKHPRNMEDDQLRAVAENGGVACTTFVTQFVSDTLRSALEVRGLNAPATAEERALYNEVMHELEMPAYTEIVDHIDHMVETAGIDHVGLGSDFGVIDTTPVGMEDASRFPWITEELLRRGYTDEDVRKILGENVLRVMEDVIGE